MSEPRRESVLARSMANCHKIEGEPRALSLAERSVQLLSRTLFFCFPIFLTRAVFLFLLVMPRTPRTHRRDAVRAATAERPQRDGTSPDVAMRLLQAAMPLPRLVFEQTDTESETGDGGGGGQQQQQQRTGWPCRAGG